jgi:uncharacterized membrane protein YgdD (TMEM256/DUF423 family)
VTSKLERMIAVLAGLMGAAGVALAAAAAHLANGALLSQAALMALVHAPALLSILVARRAGLLSEKLSLLGATSLALGAVLFSGDLALKTFTGFSLFPYAAPSGGLALISGWILIAISGFFVKIRKA